MEIKTELVYIIWQAYAYFKVIIDYSSINYEYLYNIVEFFSIYNNKFIIKKIN